MFNKIFKNNKPLIGMIHLPPLPGYIKHPGMKKVIDKALTDLVTLQKAGYDGVLVENDNDQPHRIKVPLIIKKAFSEVMTKILKQATIPAGMEILYDMEATVKIAQKVGAQFVRLDVFVDNVRTKWGKIPAQASRLVKLRNKTADKKLLLLTDIQVKHAKMLDRKTLQQSASEAIKYGADALIVTGDWTGVPPTVKDCQAAGKISQNIPVLVGSGLNNDNIGQFFRFVDGAIVGTAIKTGDYIDPKKAGQLVKTANKISNNS